MNETHFWTAFLLCFKYKFKLIHFYIGFQFQILYAGKKQQQLSIVTVDNIDTEYSALH